jgi:regulator of protease activity HflC (stomatin/prohibitin superfamily)
MALIGYFKGEPTEYLLMYRSGKLRRAGPGLAFYYWAPSTSIVSIPTGTIDVQFILNETTGNFQAVTLQGQLTYRITDPKAMATILNYSIDPATRAYRSSDPEKPAQRIVNEVQRHARVELLRLSLADALRQSAEIGGSVLAAVKQSQALTEIGIEVLSLYITAIKPTPEMAKALEAEYRESLLIKADQAIYMRRATAVEQERRIKENELSTAVTLEEKRRELVDLQGRNGQQQAEYEASATAVRLTPYKELAPQTLLALALKELAQNADQIGNLTITSEILASLLNK